MKNLLMIFLSIFSLSSCSNTECNDNEKHIYSVDVNNDIESFNMKTREIVLKSGTIIAEKLSSIEVFETKIGLSSLATFNLDGSTLFESIPMQPDFSNLIFNDLTFVIKDSKCYLLDGYPYLESLGDSKAESEKIRNENSEKRKPNWDYFINYLQKVGRIVE